MPFEQPKFEKPSASSGEKSDKEKTEITEKEIIWENKLREVEEIRDSLDERVDDGIKETVAAFNLNGFPTSGSCEGHVDRGIAAPWVEVSAPSQPEERFIGEKHIFQKVADKYGVSLEEVKRGINYDAYVEALKESSNAEETPEYKQWREENKKLMQKAAELLKEFYQERKVSSSVKLIIDEGGEGEFRVHNGGKDYNLELKKINEKQKEKLRQRLLEYQKEMQEFTKFLKEKYFKNENSQS